MQIMGDWAKGEFAAAGKTGNKDYLCAPTPSKGGYILNSDSFAMFKVKGARASRGAAGEGPSNASMITPASAAGFPTGTRVPSRPSWRISLGPLGQSVETTLAPAARASISTVGSPSQAEESTNTLEAAM